MRRPKRRSGEGDRQRDEQRHDDADGPFARNSLSGFGSGRHMGNAGVTDRAHQHHRKADDVEHVHAQQVGPRHPSPAQQKFLHAKQQAQPENLRAAADGGARNLACGDSFAAQAAGDQREGNSREKQEQRCRERSAELRPFKPGGVARVVAEPRIVAMRLKHEDARKAAHPINVAEPLPVFFRHGRGLH